MVIGGGPEYFSYQVNPTHARERFREALDLIVKAWTTPGPFLWNSKHYFFRYVNPWPRPLQQPHPPIWIPGAGSLETIEFVAQRRYAYMGIPYFHIDVFRRVFDHVPRGVRRRPATPPTPEQMGWGVPIYVAETDGRPARSSSRTCGISCATCSRTSLWRRRATPRPSSAAGHHKNRGYFLAGAEDLGRHREGRLRHRRQPGDGAAEAGSLPERAGRRRGADRLPDRHADARTGAQKHGTAGPRGAAPCSRRLKKLKYGARVLLSRKGGEAETIDVNGRPTVDPARRRRARRSSTCTARSASRCAGCRSIRPGPSTSRSTCRRIPASARAAASTRSTRIEDMAFHYVELFDALGSGRGDPGRRQPGRLDRGGVRGALAGARQEAVALRRAGPVGGGRAAAGPVPRHADKREAPRAAVPRSGRLHGPAGHRGRRRRRADAVRRTSR